MTSSANFSLPALFESRLAAFFSPVKFAVSAVWDRRGTRRTAAFLETAKGGDTTFPGRTVVSLAPAAAGPCIFTTRHPTAAAHHRCL